MEVIVEVMSSKSDNESVNAIGEVLRANGFRMVAGEEHCAIWPAGIEWHPYFIVCRFTARNGRVALRYEFRRLTRVVTRLWQGGVSLIGISAMSLALAFQKDVIPSFVALVTCLGLVAVVEAVQRVMWARTENTRHSVTEGVKDRLAFGI